MRGILTRSFLLALPLAGCGFDTVAEPAAQNQSGSGAGGTSNNTAGTPASSAGTAPSSSGSAGSAGESAGGTSSMVVTPQGGSASQAGSPSGGSVAQGGAAAGGTGGVSSGGSGGIASGGSAAVDPHFKLAWRDDFDAFDAARWTKQTHTFDENLARFSANNVVVEGGFLKLRVTKVQNGDKAYSAAEVATKDQFTFGRFVSRIKFCGGSGMVSSLFTYHDDVNTSWQEIDIEHLGNLATSVQYNLIWGSLNDRKYQPKVVNLKFSPPQEFHDYSIQWEPAGVTFFIDGAQTHHDVQATLKDAARLHMNAWPTNNAFTSFAGPFDPNAVPCEAQYDWVEAYTYVP
jgi:beta-glucanase (GH16 family)